METGMDGAHCVQWGEDLIAEVQTQEDTAAECIAEGLV